ncbi:MAG: hypothetical protein GF331_10195 [Chitinivibrionales bacterium]|nr:hypothetical protein [Chitinivibrionales bacterium]
MRTACSVHLVHLLLCFSVGARTWYVSPGGDNNAAGTVDRPFRTIQHAAERMASGDECVIRAGIYREEVVPPVDNLTFKAYQDEYVLVTGTERLSGWEKYRGDIYQAAVGSIETEYSQLFVNGKYMQMARYPDNTTGDMLDFSEISGYGECVVYKGSGSGTRRAVMTNMDVSNGFFDGGIFRGITAKKWCNPSGRIVSSGGNELQVDPLYDRWESGHTCMLDLDGSGEGRGFILHLNALDSPGEWHIEDGTCYLWPPENMHPDDLRIEYQRRKWVFNLNDRKGITLDGLAIKAGSITMINSDNCKILNSSARYLKPFFIDETIDHRPLYSGIYLDGDNNEFRNCYIGRTWGDGLSFFGGQFNKVKNCIIEDVNWNAVFASGIYLEGALNSEVDSCTIRNSGRFLLRTHGRFFLSHTDFSGAMKLGQDAGAVQAVGIDMDGAEISYNTIHDCHALLYDGSEYDKQYVVAFYLEDSYNYTLHHNLVYNVKSDTYPDGTFLYMGPRDRHIGNCSIYNNTVWNCDWRIRVWARDGSLKDVRFYNNVFDSRMKNKYDQQYQAFTFTNNMDISPADLSSYFVDAAANDFTPKESSPLIDAGREIEPFTNGYAGSSPDIGAFEYGKLPWRSGATIDMPTFEEEAGEIVGISPASALDQHGLMHARTITRLVGLHHPIDYLRPEQKLYTLKGQYVGTAGELMRQRKQRDLNQLFISRLLVK